MSILSTYVQQRPQSRELYERAQTVFTSGVNADRRAVEPFPIYFSRASGSHKWDVDGNEYIDYNMGNGAVFLGHANPEIKGAIQAAAETVSHFGSGHDREIEWGARIQALVPSCERLRFAVSGTEVTMLAMRVARAYTGRPKILRFEGHYHGWHDHAVVGMAMPFDMAGSGGVPDGVIENTIVIPANDLELVEETIRTHQNDIAAVIIEPSGASWGTVPLAAGFLEGLRSITERYGVLLIFDEVITGFRWSPGGAQAVFGITPDLTTMAKIVAGGMPGAVVGGRADIMDSVMVRTEGASKDIGSRVFHAGTYAAHAITAAAGIAALKLLATGEYQATANRLGAKLRNQLNRLMVEHEISGCAYGDASAFHLYLGDAVRWESGMPTLATDDAEVLKSMQPAVVAGLQQALQNRGIDMLSYNGGMVSGVHTDEDIERTVEAFDGAFRDLVDEGVLEGR